MKSLPALAALTVLLPVTAIAAQPGSFSDLDRNQDGYIDEQEAREHDQLAARFTDADRDEDGKLSREEFAIVMAGIRMDSDRDKRT